MGQMSHKDPAGNSASQALTRVGPEDVQRLAPPAMFPLFLLLRLEAFCPSSYDW